MPWSFEERSKELNTIFVTRNGFAIGEIEGRWLISDRLQEKPIELTKVQYAIWNAAAGGAFLRQVVDTVTANLSISIEDALLFLNNEGHLLVVMGFLNEEDLEGLQWLRN